jgi:hypothetical protein
MGKNELDVFNPKAVATPDEIKVKVVALQEQLLKLPQANIVTLHSFRAGFYERTIVIPPWTVLTGAEHKTAYQVRIDKGTIAVNVEGWKRKNYVCSSVIWCRNRYPTRPALV